MIISKIFTVLGFGSLLGFVWLLVLGHIQVNPWLGGLAFFTFFGVGFIGAAIVFQKKKE